MLVLDMMKFCALYIPYPFLLPLKYLTLATLNPPVTTPTTPPPSPSQFLWAHKTVRLIKAKSQFAQRSRKHSTASFGLLLPLCFLSIE